MRGSDSESEGEASVDEEDEEEDAAAAFTSSQAPLRLTSIDNDALDVVFACLPAYEAIAVMCGVCRTFRAPRSVAWRTLRFVASELAPSGDGLPLHPEAVGRMRKEILVGRTHVHELVVWADVGVGRARTQDVYKLLSLFDFVRTLRLWGTLCTTACLCQVRAPQVKKLVVVDVPGLLGNDNPCSATLAAFIVRHGVAITHLTVSPLALHTELWRLPVLESIKLREKAPCRGITTRWTEVACFATACPTLRELDVARLILPRPTANMSLGSVCVLRAELERTNKRVPPAFQSMPSSRPCWSSHSASLSSGVATTSRGPSPHL